jgi:hypothetical protein
MATQAINTPKGRPDMQKTTTGLAALAIGAAAFAISFAPSAAADSSKNCQTSGAVTVCAQGSVTGVGGQSVAPGRGVVWPVGCTTPYGTYQNCAVQSNSWYWWPM